MLGPAEVKNGSQIARKPKPIWLGNPKIQSQKCDLRYHQGVGFTGGEAAGNDGGTFEQPNRQPDLFRAPFPF